VHINAPKPGLPFPRSPARRRSLRAAARSSRAQTLAWWTIETTRGVYEFSVTGFDTLVDELFDASINPVLTLDFVNTLLDCPIVGSSPSMLKSVRRSRTSPSV
jgi:hypothetical protein